MRVLPALNGAAAAAAVPPPPAPPPPTPAPVVKVFLNIYDISPINNYLYWFGLGIFHSGVEGTLPTYLPPPLLSSSILLSDNISETTATMCAREEKETLLTTILAKFRKLPPALILAAGSS